jgi:hypothetical protein
MVGHETVRRNCELLVASGSTNLRQHQIDGCSISKACLPRMTAERQEISVQTDVVEGAKMAGFMCWHADPISNGRSVRLKPDAAGMR